MLEKYDGLSVFWNGMNALYTRHGNVIPVPSWFSSHLPNIPIAGELWHGYRESVDWNNARLMVFDAPLMFGAKYEDRIAYLQTRFLFPSTSLITCRHYFR